MGRCRRSLGGERGVSGGALGGGEGTGRTVVEVGVVFVEEEVLAH